MRLILASFIACGALFFTVPIMAGGSLHLCQDVPPGATDSNAAMSGSATQMYTVITSSAAMGSAEHNKEMRLHPHAPPVISCTAAFWESL